MYPLCNTWLDLRVHIDCRRNLHADQRDQRGPSYTADKHTKGCHLEVSVGKSGRHDRQLRQSEYTWLTGTGRLCPNSIVFHLRIYFPDPRMARGKAAVVPVNEPATQVLVPTVFAELRW